MSQPSLSSVKLRHSAHALKKCSDPDILNAIITYYNNANYPKTRTGVNKEDDWACSQGGHAGKNICDILFEEKQEKYSDLYTDTPTVNVTQKTQRFTMKDMGGCQFEVDSQEGFRGSPGGGLPMKEGFQVTKVPSVINGVSPSLNPAYTGSGCELDCTKADILTAMKQKYQSANIEGFQNRKARNRGGFFSNMFASFSEAFQDVTEGGDPTVVDTSATDATATDATATDATASGCDCQWMRLRQMRQRQMRQRLMPHLQTRVPKTGMLLPRNSPPRKPPL
jgi:hypothetical protein